MGRTLGIYKKVSLEKAAEGWDECYLVFKPFRFENLETIIKYYGADKKDPEAQADPKALTENKVAMTKELIESLKQLFVSGKVKDLDGNLIDAEADDIDDLFLAAGGDIMNGMYGLTDPKSSAVSTK